LLLNRRLVVELKKLKEHFMNYQFPPEIESRVKEHMASGCYASEEELFADAPRALDGIKMQQEQLREEIQQRVAKAGKGNSAPLDREAFKVEARRRFSQQS
jgi:Arc/MetJ-type ribon-helix-helix transcriptional regulator